MPPSWEGRICCHPFATLMPRKARTIKNCHPLATQMPPSWESRICCHPFATPLPPFCHINKFEQKSLPLFVTLLPPLKHPKKAKTPGCHSLATLLPRKSFHSGSLNEKGSILATGARSYISAVFFSFFISAKTFVLYWQSILSLT